MRTKVAQTQVQQPFVAGQYTPCQRLLLIVIFGSDESPQSRTFRHTPHIGEDFLTLDDFVEYIEFAGNRVQQLLYWCGQMSQEFDASGAGALTGQCNVTVTCEQFSEAADEPQIGQL